MFVDANNKMVFSPDDHVLIKLLTREKEYGAKKFITEFPNKPWTMSRLNSCLILDTSRLG